MNYNGQLLIDKVIHEKYFKNTENGFFIECGAYDGVVDSNTLCFYKSKNWRGINIEAVPILFNELKKNRPEDLNLNLALSDKEGVSTFTQAVDSKYGLYNGNFGNGSLKHTEVHKQELLKRECDFVEYEVKTESLFSLFEKHIIKKPQLFILDVEGHEHTVLSTLDKISVLLQPEVWCIEYGHSGFNTIVEIMKYNKYTLDYKDSINLLFSKRKTI